MNTTPKFICVTISFMEIFNNNVLYLKIDREFKKRNIIIVNCYIVVKVNVGRIVDYYLLVRYSEIIGAFDDVRCVNESVYSRSDKYIVARSYFNGHAEIIFTPVVHV